MKKSILLIITFALSIVTVIDAQSTMEQQRERDIKIAESILSEIFGEEESGNVIFPGIRDRSVQGEYVAGFGVHFTVTPGSRGFVIRELNSENGEEIRVDVRGSEPSESDTNTDEAEERIFEYMTRYAALLSGIPDNETVRVTYSPGRNESFIWIVGSNGGQSRQSSDGISVWAQMGDLKAYRSGDISEQQLSNRINSYRLDQQEIDKDFNVFASVIETSLNSLDLEHLRVSRNPQMEYLPGLGVRYRVQVSTRPNVIFNEIKIFDDNFELKMDSLSMNLEESMKLLEESLNPLMLKLDSMMDLDLTIEEREELREELRREREMIRERQDSLRFSVRPPSPQAPPRPLAPTSPTEDVDVSPEAESIIDELLNVIENYGSTLSSLGDNEMLMINVNWSSRQEELPERTEIRIRKSALMSGQTPQIAEIERR